jgi:hypothetical protein
MSADILTPQRLDPLFVHGLLLNICVDHSNILRSVHIILNVHEGGFSELKA